MENLNKHVNCKDAIRTLRRNLKMTYTKSAGKNTVVIPDSNVALEHFLQIINKLLEKHAPCVMSKSCLFTSKPWTSRAMSNSITKNFVRKKTHNKREFMKSSLKLIEIIYKNKKNLKTVWKTIKEIINVKNNNDVSISTVY